MDFCFERPCNANATCANDKFKRRCTCKDGYVGNGEHCFDEDECVWNESTGMRKAKCSKGATCVNTVGSYRCVCKPGYTQLDDGSYLDTII